MLLAAFVMVAVLLLWGWLNNREKRAIAELPGDERRAIYLRELASFTRLCVDPPAGLRSRCSEKARFLLAFPECDGRCEDLASQLAPRATR
jgi:cytochrome b pre-mRNA-processing protein 3